MSEPVRTKSYGASVDVVSINPTGSNMNLGVTLNYDNQEGLSTDVELGFTNNPMLQSLGLNVNIGSSGASGSMTQNGGTMGTVDQDGNYEANENFLGEISGHDIAENNGTLTAQNDSDAENDSDNPRESEPQVDGLIPFLIGTGVSLVTAAATAVAGSSTSSGSGRPSSGSSGQGGSVVNPVPVRRRPEDGDDTDGSREQSGGDSNDSREQSGGDSKPVKLTTAEVKPKKDETKARQDAKDKAQKEADKKQLENRNKEVQSKADYFQKNIGELETKVNEKLKEVGKALNEGVNKFVDSLGEEGKAVKLANEAFQANPTLENAARLVQSIEDSTVSIAAGAVPFLGETLDTLMLAKDLYNKDYPSASMSMAGIMVPGVGVPVAKRILRGAVDKVKDFFKLGNKADIDWKRFNDKQFGKQSIDAVRKKEIEATKLAISESNWKEFNLSGGKKDIFETTNKIDGKNFLLAVDRAGATSSAVNIKSYKELGSAGINTPVIKDVGTGGKITHPKTGEKTGGYLVEKVDGAHSKNPMEFNKTLDNIKKDPALKEKVLDQLEVIKKMGDKKQIEDFQVIIDSQGKVTVIDPGRIINNQDAGKLLKDSQGMSNLVKSWMFELRN